MRGATRDRTSTRGVLLLLLGAALALGCDNVVDLGRYRAPSDAATDLPADTSPARDVATVDALDAATVDVPDAGPAVCAAGPSLPAADCSRECAMVAAGVCCLAWAGRWSTGWSSFLTYRPTASPAADSEMVVYGRDLGVLHLDRFQPLPGHGTYSHEETGWPTALRRFALARFGGTYVLGAYDPTAGAGHLAVLPRDPAEGTARRTPDPAWGAGYSALASLSIDGRVLFVRYDPASARARFDELIDDARGLQTRPVVSLSGAAPFHDAVGVGPAEERLLALHDDASGATRLARVDVARGCEDAGACPREPAGLSFVGPCRLDEPGVILASERGDAAREYVVYAPSSGALRVSRADASGDVTERLLRLAPDATSVAPYLYTGERRVLLYDAATGDVRSYRDGT